MISCTLYSHAMVAKISGSDLESCGLSVTAEPIVATGFHSFRLRAALGMIAWHLHALTLLGNIGQS